MSSVTAYHPEKMACWVRGQATPYLHIARALCAMDSTTKRLRIGDALTNMFRSVLELSPGGDVRFALSLLSAPALCLRVVQEIMASLADLKRCCIGIAIWDNPFRLPDLQCQAPARYHSCHSLSELTSLQLCSMLPALQSICLHACKLFIQGCALQRICCQRLTWSVDVWPPTMRILSSR